MITFKNLCEDAPYKIFKKEYKNALKNNQESIEAVSISSYSSATEEVNSRYVNLKFVLGKEFIFFTNYHSPKAFDFFNHSQISALFYWSSTNTQIRIKAKIKKTSKDFNQKYFKDRSQQKNAISISSSQSQEIESYKSVIDNYNSAIEFANLKKCPEYWGGFSFRPYYFEFWHGHESRINVRDVYDLKKGKWKNICLQP